MDNTSFSNSGEFKEIAEQARALNRQLNESLQPVFDIQRRFAESLQPIFEFQRRMAQKIEETLNRSDVRLLAAKLSEAIRQVPAFYKDFLKIIPVNLHGIDSIKDVAAITRDEGVPLVWIPRNEIVQELVQAPDSATRQQILIDQRDAILDDCIAALDESKLILEGCDSDLGALCVEWTDQTREAGKTLIAGFPSPAQSHAANIIDSILQRLSDWAGEKDKAKFRRIHVEGNINDESRTIHTLGYYLSLQPLSKAYVPWFPSWEIPPPEHFARNATVHAVGYPNVFEENYGLIAVMLATSLTRQLANDVANIYSNSETAEQV